MASPADDTPPFNKVPPLEPSPYPYVATGNIPVFITGGDSTSGISLSPDQFNTLINAISSTGDDTASIVVDTIVSTAVDGSAVQLLANDDSRIEVWLSTNDSTQQAWWGPNSNVQQNEVSQIGLNFPGITRIKTKSAIWVKGAIGSTITARSFKR